MQGVILIMSLILSAVPALADDRVGLCEPFDTVEGWVAGQAPGHPDERYAPKAMNPY